MYFASFLSFILFYQADTWMLLSPWGFLSFFCLLFFPLALSFTIIISFFFIFVYNEHTDGLYFLDKHFSNFVFLLISSLGGDFLFGFVLCFLFCCFSDYIYVCLLYFLAFSLIFLAFIFVAHFRTASSILLLLLGSIIFIQNYAFILVHHFF